MLEMLPIALVMADFVGTRSYVEPVTLDERVGFIVEQDDRMLVIGCGDRGAGEVSIFVKPDFDETPEQNFLTPTRYRFGAQDRAKSGPWKASGEYLRYDDRKLGSSKAKAQFLDAMANDTEFHIRFHSYRGEVTASFEYGTAGARELWKMLQACRPAKVMRELEKMDSVLASASAPADFGSKVKNSVR